MASKGRVIAKPPKDKDRPVHGKSLERELIQHDEDLVTKRRNKTKKRKNEEDEEPEVPMSASLSKKILQQAQAQNNELDSDEEISKPAKEKSAIKSGFGSKKAKADVADSSDDDEDSLNASEDDQAAYDHEELEIDGEDEKALEELMGTNRTERRTLADIIMQKIQEKQQRGPEQGPASAEGKPPPLNAKVVQVYTGLGKFLKTYSSGKVPKALKIIPGLVNWEEVLWLTAPHEWSAPAVYQATRLFASNLNAKMAQRFYNVILLPQVREDIQAHKRLNFHLYHALKKSLYKPAAFYKGILFPLCEEQDCTLREATIVASVLARSSVPPLHSAAAIIKLTELPYTGATSIFLRTLLDKKYALPYAVIDALVQHFVSFTNNPASLPVLWHQALLTFVQRYKTELTEEARQVLKPLLRNHEHPKITPEIRRELFRVTIHHPDAAMAEV